MCNQIKGMLDHQIIFFMYLPGNISHSKFKSRHYEVNKILVFEIFDFDFDQSASILSIWIHSNVLEKSLPNPGKYACLKGYYTPEQLVQIH